MMQFLRALFRQYRDFFHSTDAQHEIDDAERITRYLLNRKGRFSPNANRVKYAAFLPAPNGETSVYRTSNVTEHDIWDIGAQYVAKPQSATIKARGDLKAIHIHNIGLLIESEPTPHPLHANIVNWPEEKHEQKMLALQLANHATLCIPPN